MKGNDNIQGNGGDDLIYGGDGGDNIQGGSKVDKIFGQDGNDYLFADSSTSLLGSLEQSKVDVVSRSNDSIATLKTATISKEEFRPTAIMRIMLICLHNLMSTSLRLKKASWMAERETIIFMVAVVTMFSLGDQDMMSLIVVKE